jgi:AcrR family transcriptional regulator
MREQSARERITREATYLFSQKGYERTTIPDIQMASGLSPGAGGLYRHFPSKQALLEEIVLRRIDSFEQQAQRLALETDREPRAFLELLGKAVLDEFAVGRDDVRIALRDLDRFPHLQKEFRERRIQRSYLFLSAWLRAQVGKGSLREHDSKAMAVAVLASLVCFRILEALTGEPPVRIAESRLLAAWLDLVLTGLERPAPLQSAPRAPSRARAGERGAPT